MGNKQSTELKDKYMNGHYKHILEHKDFQLGKYNLFRYLDEKVLYLKKDINPSEFDDYTSDWNMFENKVFSKCENLCELKFFVTSKDNEEIYDIIFEFGNYINTHLNNEKVIWDFINDVLKALLFLQHQNLYYPLLRKRYTVFVTETNSFKILSPYAFSSFMKEAITVFFNPNVAMLKKKEICGKNINRNVKEFGIMILALIHNVEDVVIYKNPVLIKDILKFVKKNFSVKLYDFLTFTIETRERMTFTDLEHYLLNYEKIKINQIQKISRTEQKSPINIVSKNMENIQMGQSPRKMEQKMKFDNNMTMTIKKPFSPALQQKTPMLSGNISSFGLEDKKEVKKNIQNQDELLQKKRKEQLRIQEQERIEEEKKNQSQKKQAKLEKEKQDRLEIEKQAQLKKEKQSQIEKESQARIEKEKQAQLEKESQARIEKEKQVQLEKEKQTQIEKEKQVQIEKQEKQKEPKKPENIFEKYPGKKIKRLVIKWITAENCSREFIEFEDGTLVEKESDQNQVKDIMNNYYKKNNIKKPDNDEKKKAEKIEEELTKKAEVYDPTKILKVEEEKEEEKIKYLVPRNDDFIYDINKGKNFKEEKMGFIISLNTGDGNKTKKILSSKISFFDGCYKDLKNIVDFDQKIKPSIYHHVE